jgi:hypothetical protein
MINNPNREELAKELEHMYLKGTLGTSYFLEVTDFILANQKKVWAEAVEAAVTHIASAKTEGLFDDGDLFIKRAPVEQAFVDLIGYEKFKALMDSLPAANLTPKGSEDEQR